MHPIVGQLRRIGFYLLGWLPVALLLFFLIAGHGGMDQTGAAILIPILCFVYALMCLSAWYSCRGIPLESSGILKPLLTHTMAAAVLSSFWVLIGRALASALSRVGPFHGADAAMTRNTPFLFGTGVLLYLLSVAMYYILMALQASREAEQRALEALVLARDAELKALKAQVNPHFLFNSLHSISALTSIDPGRARQMCIALADFLRLTLAFGARETISLEEEISLLRSYLAVEKIRFGQRLQMQEEVQQEALNCHLPPLLLQPLIENAVTHGIANLPEGGWIRLKIAFENEGENLHVFVDNSYDPDAPQRRKSGLGMANVKQRINARYGERAKFESRPAGASFGVDLVFPAERKTPA